ncbi:LAO/AO transport system ATPase [Acidimicrobium ferrooxidans DSM 10331]|uniref:LAO/AO transport system ATPase n=1 Tax=Acidimicrobium ferrooxidans (strain DSM 10331 / JCM 15462 / NBRC 103882 / ICP) TaxID=525909 RepID=C7M146_ACIFD|nr:methylmalonyl Co-A mutase-associated GTPase MeaB [Acidimicrobium ferrooxidans]ACU54694.1 LAO/AO transport system ATPase [Acidimicrobium ferrooxidans DSM 10331]
MSDLEELVGRARAGDRGATARLISVVERRAGAGEPIGIADLWSARPRVVVGVTGSPGAGKSTLVDRLVGAWRTRGHRVGVVAVDPSSPFSGGAILGDRVRMQGHTHDPDVFIRSVATRGALGGLARSVPEIVRLLGLVGYDLVVIETVGVGQVEVEVVGEADVTVVVITPGWGDAIQANKAGIMEIADLFVINKADRAGLAETRRDLVAMLDLGHREPRPPILETVATSGEGTDAVAEAVVALAAELDDRGILKSRVAARRRRAVERVIVDRVLRAAADADQAVWAQVEAGTVDPGAAADALLDALEIAPGHGARGGSSDE